MADLLKKRWLDGQLLELLSSAQSSRLAFLGKRYLQVRSFHSFRHQIGHPDYNPGSLITATISDTHTAIRCRFTLDAEKNFEQEKHYNLTTIRGAVLGKISGYLCLELADNGSGADVILEIHSFKIYSAPRIDGACFGQPAWFANMQETKRYLNSHQVLSLLSRLDSEEVRSQANYSSCSSPARDEATTDVIHTQRLKRKRSISRSPSHSQVKSTEKSALHVPYSEMVSGTVLIQRKRLHTGWADFMDLSYYDCQIPAAQQAVLALESCWMPKGDYKIESIHYKKHSLPPGIDPQSKLSFGKGTVKRANANAAEAEDDDAVSWNESAPPTPHRSKTTTVDVDERELVSLADLNRLRAQIVSHQPPPDSDDEGSPDDTRVASNLTSNTLREIFIPPPLANIVEKGSQDIVIESDLVQEASTLQVAGAIDAAEVHEPESDLPHHVSQESLSAGQQRPTKQATTESHEPTSAQTRSSQSDTISAIAPEAETALPATQMSTIPDSHKRNSLPPYDIARQKFATKSPSNAPGDLPSPYDIARRNTPQRKRRRVTASPALLSRAWQSRTHAFVSTPNGKTIFPNAPSLVEDTPQQDLNTPRTRSESPDHFLPPQPHPSLKFNNSTVQTQKQITPLRDITEHVSTPEESILAPEFAQSQTHKRRVSRIKFNLQKLSAQDDGLDVIDLLRRDRNNFVKLHRPPPDQSLNLDEFVHTDSTDASASEETSIPIPPTTNAQGQVVVRTSGISSQVEDSMEKNIVDGPVSQDSYSSSSVPPFQVVIVRPAIESPLRARTSKLVLAEVEDSQTVGSTNASVLAQLSDILRTDVKEEEQYDIHSWRTICDD